VNAVNQAVDGVSNHIMVHWLADANLANRALIYEAAFAVRQIEVALTSYFCPFFGSTLGILGLAMLLSTWYPTWLGVIGL
jgi:hypothetical protein